MFQVNNKDTILLSLFLTSGVIIVNFEQMSHIFLVFLLLTFSK